MTEIAGPGFGYLIQVVDREGVKTIAGKALPKPVAGTDSPLQMRLIAKKDSYVLDLGGQTGAEYRKMLEEANKKNAYASSASVDLVLEIHNTSDKARAIYLDGDFFNFGWQLDGPGAVFTVHAPQVTADVKIGKPIWIEPGKVYSKKIGSLQGGNRGIVTGVCWTEPGEYTLTAVYRLKGQPKEDDLKLVSTPVKLKVVAAQPAGKLDDYLTKDGKLKERVELNDGSGPGGIARVDVTTSRIIETDGTWTHKVVETVEGNKKAQQLGQGTLSAAELANLARVLARHDLAGLPNLGEPEIGPTLSISFGKKTSTHYAILGGAATGESKAIRARYAAISTEIRAACVAPTTGPLQLRIVAGKDAYTLDLGGKTGEEFRKLLEKINTPPLKFSPKLPDGPKVDLTLEIVNTSAKAVTVWQNGNALGLRLHLRGPGAVSMRGGVSAQIPEEGLAWQSITIAPGKSHALAITDLDSQDQIWHRSYWTEPGDYLLSASLTLYPQKADEKNVPIVRPVIQLVSPTIKLQVSPAKGPESKKASADRIKGMKAAVADVEAGNLKWKELPLPYPAWHPRYVALLKTECGIQYLSVADTKPAELEGYNDVMRAEIEHRFGHGVMGRLHKKAHDEHFNKVLPQKKDDDQPAKKATPYRELDSEILSVKLSLPETQADIAAFSLQGALADRGEGKGKLSLDVKKRLFNEIGEVAAISDTADIHLDCTFKYVKSMKARPGPLPTAEQEWHLYEIKGGKITTRLFLALPANEHHDGRLLIKDKDGTVLHVIRLIPRKFPGCHPGCFPAGTLVQTPKGTRPIDHIHAGDVVTTVRPDGVTATGQVQSVFVTQNRLVKVETDDGVLITTLTQPLCLADGQIRATEELKPGDQIYRWRDGKRVAVTVRSVTLTIRQEKVFNLILGDSEVFIAAGFLARSKPPVVALPNDVQLAPPDQQDKSPRPTRR